MSNAIVSEGLILRCAIFLVSGKREREPYEIRVEYHDDLNDRVRSMHEYDEVVLQPAIEAAMKHKRPVGHAEWGGGQYVVTEAYDGISGRLCHVYDPTDDARKLRIDLRVTDQRDPELAERKK